ncbi:beta-N-acetylhexosaminidase [Ructibacterium gallinarum]|uniref:Beta-N-acetylhexosaminidase n=1 Tax=Ructibacterium gallinarum TaxID=2779355 RepID=A0A9D5R9W5_9FIRM|nr:beta-N-acetylhexosaminidase [Ructibacterium gallinarum]MBE5040914.1 beta-N-acetylhexosaminidase [Ructibacterium gallinarum]
MNFKRKGIMIDCSRNAVRSVNAIKKFIDLMKQLEFNTLMLYTEDTYEIDTQPYFGYLRGRYSKAELKEIDTYCILNGIELIPCIQTLAHLNGIVNWKIYEEITDCNDILLVDDDRTYSLIDDMLRNISETFSSKNIHIGMDEAWMLGLGKYLKRNGYTKPTVIMQKHLERVAFIAKKYGFKPMMWSDMFFRIVSDGYRVQSPDEIDENICNILPKNVTPVFWNYYSLEKSFYDVMMQAHKNFKKNFWFAGGLWTWTGFVPHNLYSIETSKVAIESCIDHEVENIFFTMWGDNGVESSLFSILPSMYYVSQLLKGISDDKKIKQGFRSFCGIEYDDFIQIDIPEINYILENKIKNVNPEKYMLYTDYFLGIFDSITDSSRNQIYKETAKKIEKLTSDKNYGYMFKNIQALLKVLAIKNDLGIRTRCAYQAKDKIELKSLIMDYENIEAELHNFYEAFKTLWYKENKPYGFEIHENRIGGLMLRTKSCRKRLEDYVNGVIVKIDELEEIILDPECDPDGQKREISRNEWNKYFVNIM